MKKWILWVFGVLLVITCTWIFYAIGVVDKIKNHPQDMSCWEQTHLCPYITNLSLLGVVAIMGPYTLVSAALVFYSCRKFK